MEAFGVVEKQIKAEIVKSRHHWDKHEPKMWSRAAGISDHDLVDFDFEKDLVEIRSAIVSYGTIVLGKLRLPAVDDAEGEGFVHVRIHDPPNRVCSHPVLSAFVIPLCVVLAVREKKV